ncbi:MAG: hypothetical protein M1399_09225 [Actinobacteria bacterium]|nr:hypothetical protein [Actinomycetota bacterium]MCL5446798.1 hypothetical protein [Actinomycetota bacterium]
MGFHVTSSMANTKRYLRKEYKAALKAVGVGTGVLMLAAGLAACSSTSKSSTTTTPKAVTSATLPPLQKVEEAPATTLGKGSADISMSVSGKDIKSTLATFTTFNLAAVGPFNFASKQGVLKLNLKGAGTIEPATILGGPATTLFTGGDLYVQPNAGSLAATLAGGEKYIQLTPVGMSTLLPVPQAETSALISNPIGLINLLTTSHMAVTDMGSSLAGGRSTEYKAVVNLAAAAAQSGPYQALFQALHSTGGSRTATIFVYLNSSGEIVNVKSPVTVPAKGTTPAITIDLGVALSNFGVAVPPVTAPPASQYKAL